MALTFPSRTAVRRAFILTPVGGTLVGLGVLLVGDDAHGLPRALGYSLIVAGFATWIAIHRGLIGPAFTARDHLRPGERRRMRLTGTLGLAVALLVLFVPPWFPDRPLWTSFVLAPAFGAATFLAASAFVRWCRDPARHGCPGAFGDCLDCDLMLPIVEYRAALNRIDDEALDAWSIDPATGAEVSVSADRRRVSLHTTDDTGREVAKLYLLANVTGFRVPRLVPVVAFDGGFRDTPDLDDDAEVARLSMGADDIRAVTDQVERTWARSR